jgi:iron complex transport system substrate-binding protein
MITSRQMMIGRAMRKVGSGKGSVIAGSDVKRREFLMRMAAGISGAVVVSAGLDPSFSSARSAFAAGEELRFEHVYGETILAKPAERVVSLGYNVHDALLALDIVPVGIRQWFGNQPYGVWPWAQSHLGDAKPQLISGEVSMEVVAGLQPDLIVAVGSGISKDEYDVLSQIAPVLMQPKDMPAYGMGWDDLTRMVGKAVGKAELAEKLVGDVEAKFKAMRDEHPDWGNLTAVCAYNFGGETGAFIGSDTRATFVAELGFKPTEKIQSLSETQGFYARLSPEDLSPLDADLLIWVSTSDKAPDIQTLPLRKTLRAHLEGREVFAGEVMAAALSFGSILSLPYALDALKGDIVLALDGDPKTQVVSATAAGLAP